MSKKDYQKEAIKKANSSLPDKPAEQRDEKSEPSIFHRCPCPECAEDDLELFDFGTFSRSEFLGVTNDGEFGCGDLESDGDYHWVLQCGSCGFKIFDTDVVLSDTLLDWADAHGQAINQQQFRCPVCGDHYLNQVETHLERIRSVRAVYEIRDHSETEAHAEVALSFERVVRGGESVRYRCEMGHELAKDDGSPVETPEELVEWLKAHSTGVRG
jgi:hypothetical protein